MSSKVERWLRTYTALSTKKRYGESLSKFCGLFDVTPEDTLEWSVEEAEERLLDWKAHLVESGLSGSTVRVRFTAVKQWFLVNRIRVMVQCKNVSAAKTYLDYIPSREDVQRLLDSAKLHHKVSIALIAFSGLRPSDVATLQFQHIKKSYKAGDEVLTINKQHQKTKQWYSTFVGYQGTRYIRSFLESRREKGEKITDTSHVVVWHQGPMEARSIRTSIRRVIERTLGRHPTDEPMRIFRTYGLRKYFRRAADKLGESTAEYLMGHVRGLESLSATYRGLRDLDPQAIEQLKKQYISILDELETEISDVALRLQLGEKSEEDKKELKAIMDRIEELEEFFMSLKKEREKG